MPGASPRPQLPELVSASPRSVPLHSLKRERLRELRAVIDALQDEQAARDPLLTSVLAQRDAGNTRCE
jgi:hypothetical protein